MASNLEPKINRIAAAKEAISAAIAGKGVTVPDGTLIDGMAELISSIEAGAGGGDYIVEKHVVTFAEEITCAAETSVELCDTAIQTPLCIGMITYADYAKGNVYVPAVSFGVGYELINSTPTSGYALGTKDSSFTSTSQGYVKLYKRQKGTFNSSFDNGLFVKDGKLRWNNYSGLGVLGNQSAIFPSGSTYYFLILGASA